MKNPTAAEINLRNAEFWAVRKKLLEAQLADELIRSLAFDRLADEQRRGIPLYFQKTLEGAAESAARELSLTKKHVLKEQAGKGGRAKKTDRLQELIVSIVEKNPQVTARELSGMLTRDRFPNLIEDRDGDSISFKTTGDGSKEAALSGLKDRLSRAKKKIRESR